MSEEKEIKEYVEQFRRKQLRLKDFDPRQTRLTDWIVEKRDDDRIILRSKDKRALVILQELTKSWLVVLKDYFIVTLDSKKYEDLADAINALVYACKYWEREGHLPLELP